MQDEPLSFCIILLWRKVTFGYKDRQILTFGSELFLLASPIEQEAVPF